jgi:hypothetical protein
MNVYVIFKQLVDEQTGNISSVEIIEGDINEQSAASFVKLYNLQIPFDLRNKVSYGYVPGKVA